jgi:hypothetical protein
MDRITFKLKGSDRILLHSDRGANPMDPDTIALGKLTAKKKKTPADHEEISRLSWALAFYGDPNKEGILIPARMPWMACCQGATKMKLGAQMKQGTLLDAKELIPLRWEGQEKFKSSKSLLDDLWKDGSYADARLVGVNQRRILRVRPVFAGWSVEISFFFDNTAIDDDHIRTSMANAGRFYGIGDFRPECSGPFGRFEVESCKVDRGVA